MITSRWLMLMLLFAGVQIPAARAQSLTITQAVQQALDKYPAVRASLEQVSAAAAAIGLARTSYLPRADFLGQVNRATRNNVFGLLFPQSVIPSISGPVLGTNTGTSVWGSAVGGLASWEPFDFGRRSAEVNLAESVRQARQADTEITKLEVATAAADAFLTILAAQQATVAARASVDRAKALADVTGALTRSELRPGAELSRARAEQALAETQLIRAQQAVEIAKASLAQLLGVAPSSISIENGPLLGTPASEAPATADVTHHPLAVEQNALLGEVKARERILDRSYFPTFHLQGATFGRGSGARTDGSAAGGADGLGPNIGNWAVGLTVYFPVFDLPVLRARKQIESHQERSQAARYDKIVQDLNGEVEKAKAQLEGARRVAQQTPVQLDAARAAEQQAAARYRAGLGTVVEVAEAQRLLTQAEIDDSLAKLNIWRALLIQAAAQGDLQPFLAQSAK